MHIIRLPDHLHFITETGLRTLEIKAETGHDDVTVCLTVTAAGLAIHLNADSTPVRGLHLRWNENPPSRALYQRDAWGRQDGDQAWKTLTPHEPMPWQFHLHHNGQTDSYGVRTNPDALASWQIDTEGTSLFLDTRNGDSGVLLGGRTLLLADIRSRQGQPGESPFAAARIFANELVTQPVRSTGELYYGGNNWYYAYGIITHNSCIADAKRIGQWTRDLGERPYMLIDDGWQVAHCDNRYNSGPWHTGNSEFPDMPGLAAAMRTQGTRPGIWYRPLVTLEGHMERFQIKNGRKPPYSVSGYAMDPTYPEVRERLRADAARFAAWGFELIKHDFTTVDLLGSWLNTHEPVVHAAASSWSFHDRTRTNAEIVKTLYADICQAAGPATRILGCQTIGHLAIGTIDIQRTGGDVDGRGWERTRRMGPNSLAFRQAQHGIFFQCDADCAPITPTLPLPCSRQWLDLLARSGTPLFISADPRSINPETNKLIIEALTTAASRPPLAEPLDWLETPTPRVWQCGSETKTYSWLPEIGCAPAGLVPGDPLRLLHQAHNNGLASA